MRRYVEKDEWEKRQQAAKKYGLPEIEKKYLPNVAKLKTRLKNLEKYGFSMEEIIEMVRKLPSIPAYTAERINKLLRNLEKYGFSKEQVIKIVVKQPAILNYTAERINKLLRNLEKYGFSKEQVIKIVVKQPAILNYTAERINKLLRNLEKYGFSKEQVIKMVVELPTILGYTAERTGNSIEWFRFHRIEVDLVKKPFYLISGLKTLEDRRQKLEALEFDYQRKFYPLFYSKKRWEKFLAKISTLK